jgi:glycosyltransferase involved in cell wall biosynthesis
VLLWHGWLLEGSGSNVYTARVADVLRRWGHDVLLLCQERHVERYGFLDAWGTVGPAGVSALTSASRPGRPGRGILLRPDIGTLLPVFVIDEYEGFEVKRFVDLSDRELWSYLDRNVAALRAAASWFAPDAVIAAHAIPGAVVAARALGPGAYTAKIHGSDLEYAIRLQPRYRTLAAEGLQRAAAVVGATADVLSRTVELVPAAAGKTRAVPPGVEVEAFQLRPRRAALEEAAARLRAAASETARGRPSDLDEKVRRAVQRRDAAALDDLAHRYDQSVPDPDAADRLLALAGHEGPLIGYLGKFIPQKGVELFLAALPLVRAETRALVVGFGLFREWLAALLQGLDGSDASALTWLMEASELTADFHAEPSKSAGLASRVTFTGRLDHRFAPSALAAMDVLVVPSVLDEAFGMVAAEAASAGALPLVARHSGLAEVGSALEEAVDRPGLFTFDPGPGAVTRIAAGLDRLLAVPQGEREELRRSVSRFVAGEWTWERTAERLLAAAGMASMRQDPVT